LHDNTKSLDYFHNSHNGRYEKYLADIILLIWKKMVLLTGPRQVGKTTLAKEMMAIFQHPQYLNWMCS